MGRKVGAVLPFSVGELGPQFPSNAMSLGSRLTFILSGILIHPIQPFGYSRHGRSLYGRRLEIGEGGAVPLSMGELGPHLTQCGLGRGLPPYQVAS